MSAFVSVVIPTYNRARYVAQAASSAAQQALPDGSTPEVIVVDDGGSDDTESVIAALPDVRYARQENQREGAARNTGAALAGGRYLAFLDSDDYYLPGKLAADVARFERVDSPALVYSRPVNVDSEGRLLGPRLLPAPEGDVFWPLARASFIPMSSAVVRADAFREIGGFVPDRALSGTADWECWMRMAARWPVGFAGDPPRTAIRVHPSSMLRDPSYMERAMLAGLKHALADPIVARRAAGREGYVRAHMYVTIAVNGYANGAERTAAGRWLLRALLAWPTILADPRLPGAVGRVVLGRRAATWLRSRVAT